MTNPNRGNGRAKIMHTPDLSRFSPGKRAARFDPGFQVPDQCAPADDEPCRQHYNAATDGLGKSEYKK